MKTAIQILSLLLLLNFQYSFVTAQNLVPNPSFEDTVSCPTGIGNFSVTEWYSPTWGSPDLFHPCNSGNVGVPQNAFGWQNARTGNAYVGCANSDFTSTDYREYIQCQLDSAFLGGQLYEVSFYVSRTDSCTKACDNIGALLSTNPVSLNDNLNLPYAPQVKSQDNNPIIDNISWIRIIDTILASGGEQYLTIGVFSDNANTNWINVSGGWEAEAHYYIDDVSVKRVYTNVVIEIPKPLMKIFPNPVKNEPISVIGNDIIESILVTTIEGKILFKGHPNSNNFRIDFTPYPPGIYFLKSFSENKFQIVKIINQ